MDFPDVDDSSMEGPGLGWRRGRTKVERLVGRRRIDTRLVGGGMRRLDHLRRRSVEADRIKPSRAKQYQDVNLSALRSPAYIPGRALVRLVERQAVPSHLSFCPFARSLLRSYVDCWNTAEPPNCRTPSQAFPLLFLLFLFVIKFEPHTRLGTCPRHLHHLFCESR